MKPRLILAAFAVVAIAVCVALLWRDGPAGSSAASAPAPEPVAEKSKPPAGGARPPAPVAAAAKAAPHTATRWKTVDDLMKSDLFSRTASAEDIRKFLVQHGETPANLVAAFESGRDPQWLERAEQLFPNNPLVLQALITSGLQPEKLAERIERFKAADPNNPLPWIFAAEQMFKVSDPAAKEQIEAALAKPGFYTYANERMASAQALYESMGWTPLEAEMRSVFGMAFPQVQSAQTAGRSLMELEKTAVAGGDQSQADQLLQLTYGLGKMFSTPEASRFLIGQLVGYSLEARALQAMPADETLPGGSTVAERLAEMDRIKQERIALVGKFDAAIVSDQDLTAEYVRRLRQDGEMSALRWLNQQK